MDLPTGSSILKMILRLSNDTYDFSTILQVVNSYAIEAIFQRFDSEKDARQSSIFLGLLKLTCDVSGFPKFYQDLIELLNAEGITKIIQFNQIENVYSKHKTNNVL